jgi:hypothetical protein
MWRTAFHKSTRSTLATALGAAPIFTFILRAALTSAVMVAPLPAVADPFSFSTGSPDGRIGTLSRPAGIGQLETETADDFILSNPTSITQVTFTGLIPLGTPLPSITNVEIEFYHVFPVDSANPPSGNVPTRNNSPADVEIAAATRDAAAGSLTFSASVLNSSFMVANTVVNGIHSQPNQFTGGEGPATGQEVQITATFQTAVTLLADHYFFRPEVSLLSGDFLWLSAAFPDFTGDLQTWIRNDGAGALAPDWLRIGTDITHQGPFNASFSLTGDVVPLPAALPLFATGLVGLVLLGWRRKRDRLPAA